MNKVVAGGVIRATFSYWLDAYDWAKAKVSKSTLEAYYVHDAIGEVTRVTSKSGETV